MIILGANSQLRTAIEHRGKWKLSPHTCHVLFGEVGKHIHILPMESRGVLEFVRISLHKYSIGNFSNPFVFIYMCLAERV